MLLVLAALACDPPEAPPAVSAPQPAPEPTPAPTAQPAPEPTPAPPTPASPTDAAASFSCADETKLTAIEQAICWSETLSMRDGAMAAWYAAALAGDGASAARDAQRTWLADRDAGCAPGEGVEHPDHACLTAKYDARLNELAARAGVAAPGSTSGVGRWRSDVGSVELIAWPDRALGLTIETVVGPTAHICSYYGAGIAWSGDAPLTIRVEDGCELKLALSESRALTVGANDGCRYYCGARAYMDGTYLPE